MHEKKICKQSPSSQIPSPYSPGCFIATVVYGSSNHYKLEVFRDFRNNILFRYRIGRKFVWFYYRISPRIANNIRKKEILKRFILYSIIEPIHRLIEFLLH
ncbi:MAG: hypothetical protein QMD36_04290 [Candidatus Aenigmarchaeota archaeon]|nr:hypothetical protein [Candidatus Aenigmarchaeota archaeon]